MAEPPRWATRGLMVVAVVTLLILLVQYLSGIWTNLYSTSMFTSNSSSPSLDAHYDGGFALGLLGIVAIALAVLTRRARLIGQSAALFLWIVVAGIAGMAFVGNTPNPAIDSFTMAVAFLLAFGTAIGLTFSAYRGLAERPPPAAYPSGGGATA